MNEAKQLRVAEANELEAELRKLMNQSGQNHHLFVKDKNMLDGDIVCLVCKTKVEVKNDKRYQDTGNVCIAIEALSHSSADYVLFVLEGKPKEHILCRRPELMYWAWTMKYKFKELDTLCLIVKKTELLAQSFSFSVDETILHSVCELSSHHLN